MTDKKIENSNFHKSILRVGEFALIVGCLNLIMLVINFFGISATSELMQELLIIVRQIEG